MAAFPTSFRDLHLLQDMRDGKEMGVGPGNQNGLRLASSSWPPSGRVLGLAGFLNPSATPLSHGFMLLNRSRDVSGSLGHNCGIRGLDDMGARYASSENPSVKTNKPKSSLGTKRRFTSRTEPLDPAEKQGV